MTLQGGREARGIMRDQGHRDDQKKMGTNAGSAELKRKQSPDLGKPRGKSQRVKYT